MPVRAKKIRGLMGKGGAHGVWCGNVVVPSGERGRAAQIIYGQKKKQKKEEYENENESNRGNTGTFLRPRDLGHEKHKDRVAEYGCKDVCGWVQGIMGFWLNEKWTLRKKFSEGEAGGRMERTASLTGALSGGPMVPTKYPGRKGKRKGMTGEELEAESLPKGGSVPNQKNNQGGLKDWNTIPARREEYRRSYFSQTRDCTGYI